VDRTHNLAECLLGLGWRAIKVCERKSDYAESDSLDDHANVER
jgi:hypothetical protein